MADSGERTLLDKLGVKPDSRVAVLGIADSDFWRQLRERATDVTEGQPEANTYLIFLLAERREDLASLHALRAFLTPNGALWVVAPRGSREVRQEDIFACAREADLVDVKVARFSPTHTALKLVIPVAHR